MDAECYDEIIDREFSALKYNLHQFRSYKDNECDIVASLKTLTDLFRQDETRNKLSSEYLSTIGKYVAVACHPSRNSFNVCLQLLRLLRNLVAGSKKNQDFVFNKCPSIMSDTLKLAVSLLEEVENSFDNRDDKILVLRCCVQFYGNLVSGNLNNKIQVWQFLGTDCFLELLRVNDDQLTKFTSMLMHNCLLDCPSHAQALVTCGRIVETVTILLMAVREDVEWALYVLEDVICREEFVTECYAKLRPDHRLDVLDVILEMLSRGVSIRFEAVAYLANVFETSADAVFRIGESAPLDLNVTEVLKSLEVLCAACAQQDTLAKMQEMSNLLCCCASLLRGFQLAGREGSRFAVERRFASAADEVNPVFGCKRDLVRILGNLCWRHKANQDKLRDWECIPLLLDCCQLDANNPFIVQWAIFAIRNVCENNEENQSVIASLEKLGGAEDSVLSEKSVVEVESAEGGGAPRGEGVALVSQSRAQEDIKQLFL